MIDTEKNDSIFIAYKGKEFSIEEIYSALNIKCPTNYTVAYKILNDLIFAKIVDDNLIIDADPYFG